MFVMEKGEIMIIRTVYGEMRGVDHGEYVEFRRVPYAKPPVGELRFKAPVRPDAWEGVLDATEYAPKAFQEGNNGAPWGKDFYADPSFDRVPSEDCLYLNIWVPKSALEDPDASCPIAMWIHGGAFMGGYATESEFDGAAYTKRGVILASVEYRCNIFGFFAHPWLTAENGGKTSGSYGSLDQIAALEWLYENAKCLGGDPENITVFGQSAGAMSTQTLISSDLTRGKIAKAILQSGGSYGQGLHRKLPLAQQEQFGEMFTEMNGITSLEQLRAMSTEEIAAAMGPWMEKVFPIFNGLFLIPLVDGILLKDGYYELMAQGKIHDIPYMLGATENDIDVQEENRTNDKVTFLLPGSIDFSKKLAELGRKPAYVYYFTRKLPGDGWGAYHSSELMYMFGTLDRCWRPWEEHDYELSERMIDYWCNFIRTGDPNGEGLPEWRPCTGEGDVIEFN